MSRLIKGLLRPVASLFSSLFGVKKAPAIAPPAVMPTPNDESVEAAKRRKLIEMQSRSGRASTIFTDQDDDKVGG